MIIHLWIALCGIVYGAISHVGCGLHKQVLVHSVVPPHLYWLAILVWRIVVALFIFVCLTVALQLSHMVATCIGGGEGRWVCVVAPVTLHGLFSPTSTCACVSR